MDKQSKDQSLVVVEVSTSRPTAAYLLPGESDLLKRPMDLVASIRDNDLHWRPTKVESDRVVVERHSSYMVQFTPDYHERILGCIWKYLEHPGIPRYEVVYVP